MPADLTCPEGASLTGAYRLSWSAEPGVTWRLTETGPADEAARVLYEGPDVASTVTGRPEGTYTYRLDRLGAVESGDSCAVRVEPPSLVAAGLAFAVGLLVVVATVSVIWRGHRAHRRGQIG